jgi:hypothetical protein
LHNSGSSCYDLKKLEEGRQEEKNNDRREIKGRLAIRESVEKEIIMCMGRFLRLWTSVVVA